MSETSMCVRGGCEGALGKAFGRDSSFVTEVELLVEGVLGAGGLRALDDLPIVQVVQVGGD